MPLFLFWAELHLICGQLVPNTLPSSQKGGIHLVFTAMEMPKSATYSNSVIRSPSQLQSVVFVKAIIFSPKNLF